MPRVRSRNASNSPKRIPLCMTIWLTGGTCGVVMPCSLPWTPSSGRFAGLRVNPELLVILPAISSYQLRAPARPHRRAWVARSPSSADRSTGAFSKSGSARVYSDRAGHLPLPTRLMAGLSILKHMHDLSDEDLARPRSRTPCQLFCGEEVFRQKLAFDRSVADSLAPADGRGAWRR